MLPGTKGVSAWGQPVTAGPGDLAEAAAQTLPAPYSPSNDTALGSVADSLAVAKLPLWPFIPAPAVFRTF